MDRRARAVTAALTMAAVVCAGVSVVAVRGWADSRNGQDAAGEQLVAATHQVRTARHELQVQQDALADAEHRVERLMALYRPDVVVAVSQVQTTAAAAGCTQARNATRDGSALPTGGAVMDLTVVTAPASVPALHGLGRRWAGMLQPEVIQAEIDTCTADETAQIEVEQQAAADAATTAAVELPIGYADCVALYSPAECADTDGDGLAGFFRPGSD